MSVAAAEKRAAELLSEAAGSPFGDLAAPPVDVDAIAEELAGLLIVAADLHDEEAGKSYSGLLLPAKKRLLYDVSEAERWPGRRRFTIAHELGHWYVHHTAGEQRDHYCRGGEITVNVRTSYGLEREANAFAAAVLMPAELVAQEAARTRCNIGLLAQHFGVSVMAMRVRLEGMDLLPPYMR